MKISFTNVDRDQADFLLKFFSIICRSQPFCGLKKKIIIFDEKT